MQKRRNVYADFMLDFKGNREIKANTAKAYQSAINQIEKYMDDYAEHLDAESIRRYYGALLVSNLKKSTVQQRIVVLRAFTNYLYQHRLLNERLVFKNSETTYRPVDQLNYLSTLEFYNLKQKIYKNNCFRNDTDFRNSTMVAVLVNTGLSSLEISELMQDDVDVKAGTIRVCGTNDKDRMLYIADRPARTLIARYLGGRAREPGISSALFLNRQGQSISQWTVRNVVKQYLKWAGIKHNATVSMIQHSFIIDLLAKGATVTQIQNITGISSMVMSQVYAPFAKSQPGNVEVLKQLNRV